MGTMARINKRFARLEKDICDAYDRDGMVESTFAQERRARAEMQGYLDALYEAGLIHEVTVRRTMDTFDDITVQLIKEEGGKR